MSQFLQDIMDQSTVLKHCYHQYLTSSSDRLLQLSRWFQPLMPVIFVGMGSSLYAPQIVTPLLNSHGVNTSIKEAGELLHYGLNGIPRNALVIAISQSGESVETRQVVEKLAGQCRIAVITNNLDSAMAKNAELVLPMYAGVEATASTKTFVASLLVLTLATKAILKQPCSELSPHLNRLFSDLSDLTNRLTKTIGNYLDFLEGIDTLHIIGRGPALACVYHGALIMKETADSQAEGMAGGTFRHGPLELAGRGHKAIVLAPTGKTSDLNLNLALELAEYGSKVVLLTDRKIPTTNNLSVIEMPPIPENLVSLLYILPLELLAWEAARRKGKNPGVPQLISKVTVRE